MVREMLISIKIRGGSLIAAWYSSYKQPAAHAYS